MRSLAYIISMGIKNRFLEVLRKPAKLILYLLVIIVIASLMIMSLFTRNTVEDFVDIIWLKGIIFLFILLYYFIGISKGLKSGDVIFNMNDVNFLFVSPIKPQKILLYGVVRMMGMSFLAGFFILFQGNSLGMWFGIYFQDLLLILAGFIIAVSLLQIVSLIIYSYTNGNPKRKLVVRIISIAVFLPMIVNGLWHYAQSDGDMMKALEGLLRSPITSWTPLMGWTAEGTVAFISGNPLNGFIFLGVMVTLGALLLIYIMFSNPDYYEDALVATETSFEKRRIIAEGQTNMEALSGRKIKVAATGISGIGASAIFYKHLRESFRANRLGLWGVSSVFMILISVFVASISAIKDNTESVMLIIMSCLMWTQVFLIGMGRGLKELYSHYIYLIPESSFKKIVWGNLEVIFKVFVESILIFGIAGVIIGESLPLVIMYIVVFTLFSFFLVGLNYLSLRWTGADMSSGILLFFYMIAVMVIMAPGLVAAIVVGVMLKGWGMLAGLCILAVWELLIAIGCFALSKGILHNCDIPVMKIGK